MNAKLSNNCLKKELELPEISKLENSKNKLRHRGEATLRKHLREHDQKAAPSSDIRKSRNKTEFAKIRGLAKICDPANLNLTH